MTLCRLQLIRREGPINGKLSSPRLPHLRSAQLTPARIHRHQPWRQLLIFTIYDWLMYCVCTHFIKIYIIWYNYTFLWYYRKRINPFFLICSKLCPAVSIYTQVNIMRLMVDWLLFKHQTRAISKWTLAYNQYRPSGFHELLLCNCVTMRLSKLNSIETDEFTPIKQ